MVCFRRSADEGCPAMQLVQQTLDRGRVQLGVRHARKICPEQFINLFEIRAELVVSARNEPPAASKAAKRQASKALKNVVS